MYVWVAAASGSNSVRRIAAATSSTYTAWLCPLPMLGNMIVPVSSVDRQRRRPRETVPPVDQRLLKDNRRERPGQSSPSQFDLYFNLGAPMITPTKTRGRALREFALGPIVINRDCACMDEPAHASLCHCLDQSFESFEILPAARANTIGEVENNVLAFDSTYQGALICRIVP